jgi:methionyl-tRNA formyltransferase
MRIFLIIDETCFYQPDFVADLARAIQQDIVGAALVTKVGPGNNIEKHMLRSWYCFRPSELCKLVAKKLWRQWLNIFSGQDEKAGFYSVRKVYEPFGIDYFEVEYDINKAVYTDAIRAAKPDVIISSNSLIFGEKLLNIPKYCINRHSALLPSYGGLWPVFQAVRRGEPCVGVSVHTMERKIDKGVLLSQKVIPVEPDDTIDLLYRKCFRHSAPAVLAALEKIEKGDMTPVSNNYPSSYYSFPKKEHWRELRQRNRKFI